MIPVNSTRGTIHLTGTPDKCPFCHKSIMPKIIHGYHFDQYLQVLMACPDSDCQQSFIGYYHSPRHTTTAEYSGYTTTGNLTKRNFSDSINEISPNFVQIYNQAFQAEQHQLSEICGVGFRKALEFLIKDYLIKTQPEHEPEIRSSMLGRVIQTNISDLRIKSVAKRAVWLGNDETHFVRKWECKDLDDLKKLIELTVHWIEMEILTQSFEESMPDE